MGALGHFLECEGIATTQISLIYEHTAAIRPPRALWVPFELGRPLGIPNDPEFQRRVLRAALDLFGEMAGPVLAEHAEHAPESHSDETWVCPVSLKPSPDQANNGDALAAVSREIIELLPWYELGRNRRQRTLFGVSGLTKQDCARFLVALLLEDSPAHPAAGISLGETLKRTSEDLFAWYTEAAAAQPGDTTPSSGTLEDWFWSETAAGRLFLDLARTRFDHPDPLVRRVIERNLVPWTQKGRF